MTQENNFRDFIGQTVSLGPEFIYISEVGHYGEIGMMARIQSVEDKGDYLRVTADFGEFEGHNRPFESSDWFLPSGHPSGRKTGTAREAGQYKQVDEILVDPDRWHGTFKIVALSPEEAAIHEAFNAREDASQSFSEFLVATIRDAMSKGYELPAPAVAAAAP